MQQQQQQEHQNGRFIASANNTAISKAATSGKT